MKIPYLFSKSDRRSAILLCVIAVICVVGMILFGNEENASPSSSKSTSADTISSAGSTSAKTDYVQGKDGREQNASKKILFDPNTVDSATLVLVGISPRKVHTFMRYRAAGAMFRKPIDIARCYSFSDDDIDLLLPLIRIAEKYRNASSYKREKYPLPSQTNSNTTYSGHEKYPSQENTSASTIHRSNKFTTLTPVDINTADTALLKRIPGVGDAISSMIINLRDKFGGFTSVSQLSQIQQISPELMEWFMVSSEPSLRKININTASFKTLVTHPYISKDQANAILRYVRLYGNIPDAHTLQSTAIFTPGQLSQLLPYLEF